jgi:hypothetical protein
LIFANAAKKVGDGDSSRSRVATDDHDKFSGKEPPPMVTNQRC